jgi:ribosome-associated protein
VAGIGEPHSNAPANGPGPAPDHEEELSRAELRRRTKQDERVLQTLARDLVQASHKMLERLALPEAVAEAVQDARRIHSPQAKQRALRRVRQWLRDEDWRALRMRIDAACKGDPCGVAARARRWCSTLVVEGDPALDALMTSYPFADRQQMRALVRNVRRAPADRRGRAERALAAAVAELLNAGPSFDHSEDED